MWDCYDCSDEEPRYTKFCARFRNLDEKAKFVAAFESAKKENDASQGTGEAKKDEGITFINPGAEEQKEEKEAPQPEAKTEQPTEPEKVEKTETTEEAKPEEAPQQTETQEGSEKK